jgi:hypothetical protein
MLPAVSGFDRHLRVQDGQKANDDFENALVGLTIDAKHRIPGG